jgi:mannose-6-phosphate isomerase-like protein (cupin superfamily)
MQNYTEAIEAAEKALETAPEAAKATYQRTIDRLKAAHQEIASSSPLSLGFGRRVYHSRMSEKNIPMRRIRRQVRPSRSSMSRHRRTAPTVVQSNPVRGTIGRPPGRHPGEYHWHKHEADDEFFFVVEGRLFVDIEGKTFALEPRHGLTVPRGLEHRTRAPERTVILMVENAGIIPTGDARQGIPE